MKYISFTKLLMVVFAIVGVLVHNSNSDKSKLKLESFEGNWEGEGTYYLPFTNIPTSVDAKASFEYDGANKFLRTQITAERFMLKYSDSGKLAYIPKKDSLKWEIWNSFGYYVEYTGGVKEKSIHGKRKWGKNIYDLYVDLVSDDSMKIKITSTDPEGELSEIANGYLRRTKEKIE
ncbi:MAG: hypothetical protein ACREBV_02250 [Candidatus Zixiibacteriota bacterium]